MALVFKKFTGKTVEDATNTGLETLGVKKEDVEIRVLEEGKKRLFGSIPACVEIGYEETEETAENTQNEATVYATNDNSDATDGERAVEFLRGLFEIMNFPAVTELQGEDEKIVINVTTTDSNALIGKRGAVLDAVQTLAGAVANTGRGEYKRVVVDCENYRENREETLNRLANNLAQKAVRLERKLQLEPMNPYERRIIHAALSENTEVKTQSEGKEPNRYIVIIPNNLSDPNSPALDVSKDRNNGRRNDRNGGRPYNKGKYGGNKPFNRSRSDRPRSSGGSKKMSSDFFGTFLGNSKDDNN